MTLAYAAASKALQTAVAVAARNEVDLGRRGIGIPLRRADGTPCVAHVLPLWAGQILPGLTQRATAAVFVAPAASPPRMPADALALLYDLTPAEARIFELIAGGQAPSDIAVLLGIAPSTVKTHLLRVFDKTGCSRQAEIVKLAASMSSQSEGALESSACHAGPPPNGGRGATGASVRIRRAAARARLAQPGG